MSLNQQEESFLIQIYLDYSILMLKVLYEENSQANKVALYQLDKIKEISEKMILTKKDFLEVATKEELTGTHIIIKQICDGSLQVEKDILEKIEIKLKQ